jgi:23S rRNA pseudouridine2605 synthase
MSKAIRLNKFLRDCGLGARRKCEKIIEGGRVSVNGRVVEDLATTVDPDKDDVRVDGDPVTSVTEKVYLAAYKPRGALVTAADPHGRQTYIDAIGGLPGGLFSVGRLDMDSEGLLILTNDGKLGFRLAHPRYEIERVYRVWVKGAVDEDKLAQLRRGVVIDDGEARARRVDVVEAGKEATELEIALGEGRKREIRRMLAAVGLEVDRLERISFGPVGLGGLEPGMWRHLSREEVRGLRRCVQEAYLAKRRT